MQDLPVIGRNILTYKAGNVVSGDSVRITSRYIMDKFMEERGLKK